MFVATSTVGQLQVDGRQFHHMSQRVTASDLLTFTTAADEDLAPIPLILASNNLGPQWLCESCSLQSTIDSVTQSFICSKDTIPHSALKARTDASRVPNNASRLHVARRLLSGERDHIQVLDVGATHERFRASWRVDAGEVDEDDPQDLGHDGWEMPSRSQRRKG